MLPVFFVCMSTVSVWPCAFVSVSDRSVSPFVFVIVPATCVTEPLALVTCLVSEIVPSVLRLSDSWIVDVLPFALVLLIVLLPSWLTVTTRSVDLVVPSAKLTVLSIVFCPLILDMVVSKVPSPSFELETEPELALPAAPVAGFPLGCRPWRKTISAAGLIVVMGFPQSVFFVSRLPEQGPGQAKTRRLQGFRACRDRIAAKTSGTLCRLQADP